MRRDQAKYIIYLFITGRTARSAALRVFFTQGPSFPFFAPQGRQVASIKVKFGCEAWAPLRQISHSSAQRCGFTVPKLWKFQILPI